MYQSFLDTDGRSWPVCDYLPGRLVDCGEAQLWVETEGQGAPLLAIHGGPGVDHRSLHPGLSQLAGFRRVHYVDLRGHYMSPLPAVPHRGVLTDADDLEALRRALDLPALDVFGHSVGGLTALEFARRHPAAVRSVIVCSTPIGASEAQIEARMAADTISQALDRIEDQDSEEAFELYLRFYLTREPSPELRRLMRQVRDSYGSARNSALLEAREVADEAEPDWRALLDGVQCPVLVLYGEQDPIVPPEPLLEACAGRLNVQVVAFANSRHDPFHDEPETFSEAVREFLG